MHRAKFILQSSEHGQQSTLNRSRIERSEQFDGIAQFLYLYSQLVQPFSVATGMQRNCREFYVAPVERGVRHAEEALGLRDFWQFPLQSIQAAREPPDFGAIHS